MASDEEARRRLNEEKIQQDAARKQADEDSKRRIREELERKMREDRKGK
jgi:hypothetical protein